MKQRIIIIGAAGFVGAHIIKQLPATYEVIPLTRRDCDLNDPAAREIIAKTVRDGDIVVTASAKAPAKNFEMLCENISMMRNITDGLRSKKLAYLLNISSDAVYGDSMTPMDETAALEPLSAHGIMHCMREFMLGEAIAAPIGHLRPTLIYGAGDPHNGYGPNSFLRLAAEGKTISLFGNGEERRDHVHIEDVAALAVAMIEARTQGPVNAVSGEVISFLEIAEAVQKAYPSITIERKPRTGPMPHNGYRAFTNARAKQLLGKRTFKNLRDYINETAPAHAL